MNDKTAISLYWFRLIDTLKKNRLINIGPTIPYLIGARRYKEEVYNSPSDSISNLISDIINSDDEYVGVIQYCDTIENVVIGIIHRDSIGEAYENAIKANNEEGRLSLICTLDQAEYGSNINEVKNSLVGAFSSPIKLRNYSWDSFISEWVPILSNELSIIEQVDL
jgi:hypothetical protein